MSIEEKMELVRKVGLFGLKDLRKIAPIGDLGYANCWFGSKEFMKGGLENAIYRAAKEQGFKFEGRCTGWRCTDNYYYCRELGMSYGVDSGD